MHIKGYILKLKNIVLIVVVISLIKQRQEVLKKKKFHIIFCFLNNNF